MIFSLLTFLSCHYIYSETTIGANPPQFKLRDWNHKGFIYPYNCYQLQNINTHIAVMQYVTHWNFYAYYYICLGKENKRKTLTHVG